MKVTLDVNGYVSGIRSYNDGSVAGTIFLGDIFQFAFPGQSGGSPVPVVQIANVNGSPKIVWRGDMYGDELVVGYKGITEGDAAELARAVERWDIRWAILPNRYAKLVALLERSPDWRPIYKDEVGIIFVRR